MRVVIAVAISLILASSAWAEVTIKGRVLQEQRGVVANAEVSLYPDGLTTRTDERGRYSFTCKDVERFVIVKTNLKYNPCWIKKAKYLVKGEDSTGVVRLKPIILACPS